MITTALGVGLSGDSMSEGGLLGKALEQQSANDTVVAEISSEQQTNQGYGSLLGSKQLFYGLGMGLVAFLLSWVLANPSMQSNYAWAGIVPIAVLGASFFLVWTAIDRRFVEVLAVVYLLLAASPFIASSVSTSSITISESSLSPDSSEITLKVRQSGGLFSSSIDSAEVAVSLAGNVVWSDSVPFNIDRADGIGDYGLLPLTVSDFYSGNSGDTGYAVTVDTGDSSDSYDLDSKHLIRTIDDVQTESFGYMGTGSDCSGDIDNCVLGVVLTTWIGLDAIGNSRPGGMPFADYNVTATLSEGSDLAVSYPSITVVNGLATWEDSNGEFGEGEIGVGDYGSELPLDGSESATEFDRMYIPLSDFHEPTGEYGCYSFSVEVTQSSPWGADMPVESTTYYEFEKSGSTESWSLVSSC